ncbi:MAG: UDP-N-acetylglucosamine 1-carboxyvinyltransferase [Eubacteriales bacterium]|nr:UDP-N-acetylglucosamine 1-carboxyvinyltransferase [Eubacteriales bacterium]
MKKQWYEIQGGHRLEGTVTVSGAKNAAVAIIPASILADECCILENLPDIEDVNILMSILQEIGAEVTFTPGDCMRIDPTAIHTRQVTGEQVSAMRASYYLLGAMLGRYGHAEVALPGGCVIGQRPIDQHIKGFETLGATVVIEDNIVKAKADKLIGAEVYFDLVSVGATINVMLAAVMAEGQTMLINAAKEPHVVDVANFLNMMGAKIKGAGTDTIRIEGVTRLHGCSYAIIPDQIEAGTYMIAAAATGGDVIIKNVIPTHLESISAKLMESGATVIEGDDGHDFYMQVIGGNRPRPVNLKTLPYPGFPTDLQQPMMAYMCAGSGTSFIVENVFEERFNHVSELQKMGAEIALNGRTAMVEGVNAITGADIYATDLRAGAALIIAGLMAKGNTRVFNIEFIDRGYEYLEHKLTALGAVIKRCKE